MDNDLLIYKDKEGKRIVDAILKDENLWLSQKGMARLFECSVDNIGLHLKNIYESNELKENLTTEDCSVVQVEGTRKVTRKVKMYNLDAIIAVGYRVNSKRATDFRIWATKILKEYLIKGFSLNDERLKNTGKSPYFEELLARVRSIRASEKVFWRKILDLYATSVDYNPKSKTSIEFFKTVQNKMHYAVHGMTAAEVIFNRVDSSKDNIGLTNFKGNIPTMFEVEVAKNYLTEEELNILNKMVSAYLDIAELNAMSNRIMTMNDWIKELDDFLKMTKKDILKNKGKVSHEKALKKAHEEYEKYLKNHLTTAEKDYLEVLNLSIKELI